MLIFPALIDERADLIGLAASTLAAWKSPLGLAITLCIDNVLTMKESTTQLAHAQVRRKMPTLALPLSQLGRRLGGFPRLFQNFGCTLLSVCPGLQSVGTYEPNIIDVLFLLLPMCAITTIEPTVMLAPARSMIALMKLLCIRSD